MGQGLAPTLNLGGQRGKKGFNEVLDTLVSVEVAVRAFGLAEGDVDVESHTGSGYDLAGVTLRQSACLSRQRLYRGFCLQDGWIPVRGPCARLRYGAAPAWSETRVQGLG